MTGQPAVSLQSSPNVRDVRAVPAWRKERPTPGARGGAPAVVRGASDSHFGGRRHQMTVEVIGMDHIFLLVGNLGLPEGFSARVVPILVFGKGEGPIGGVPHLFSYNRQFAYSLRPA